MTICQKEVLRLAALAQDDGAGMLNLIPLQTEGLAEKLLWEKPERRDQAGQILIFGGASLKLKTVDQIYKQVTKLGSSATVLVPESLASSFKLKAPILQPVKFDNYFGLTEQGQRTLLTELASANCLILADSGNNSSTAKHLALAIAHSIKPIILTEGSLSLSLSYTLEILQNPNLTILTSPSSLRKIQKAAFKAASKKLQFPVLPSSRASAKLNALLELQELFPAKIILFDAQFILAADSKTSTYLIQELKFSQEHFAAQLACWQLWVPKANFLHQIFISLQS